MSKQQPEHIAVCPICHVKIALVEGIIPWHTRVRKNAEPSDGVLPEKCPGIGQSATADRKENAHA